MQLTVPQEQIEYLISLENQIAELKRLHDEAAHTIMRAVLSGAKVQTGCHVARIEERWNGPRRVQRLVVR